MMRRVAWLVVLTWCLGTLVTSSKEQRGTLSRKYNFSARVHRVLAARKQSQQSVASQTLVYLDRHLPVLNKSIPKHELEELQARATNFGLDFEPTGDEEVPLPPANKSRGITMHIIGGSSALRENFKYMCRMMIDKSFLCGCAIISSSWVITAAHCTKGFQEFSITCGAQDLSLRQEEGRVVKTAASKVEHPDYNDEVLLNDIALVKLSTILLLNNGYVAALRLPRKSDASVSLDGQNVTISGFGLTKEAAEGGSASQQLKQLWMLVISNAACVRFYGSYLTGNNLCCENKVAGERQSTCSGDSGGPLVRQESDGLQTLVGVVSYGSAEGCTAGPSVFSRVCNYLGWISNVTKIQIRQQALQ